MEMAHTDPAVKLARLCQTYVEGVQEGGGEIPACVLLVCGEVPADLVGVVGKDIEEVESHATFEPT